MKAYTEQIAMIRQEIFSAEAELAERTAGISGDRQTSTRRPAVRQSPTRGALRAG